MRRYVIIGSGVAGYAAAEAIRARDMSADIRMVTDDPHGFYSRPGLAYLLSGEIPERFLFSTTEEDYHCLDLHRLQAQVTCIALEEHKISLANGLSLPYDRLLVATGATARFPPVPGLNLVGVVKLDNLEDARRILQLASKAGTAVVVGGGITALELVEGLRFRKVRTHYFLRGSRYWSNVLDEEESRIVEERLKHEGVALHYNAELAEICGEKGRVSGVRTGTGEFIPCHMVGIAIGIRTRKELAEESGIRCERGILVDEYLRTSAPDVFAAGDVAQYFDPQSGQTFLDSLWGSARDVGQAAGLNMSGLIAPYRKKTSFNVTRLAGLTTTIIGRVGGGSDADLASIARGDSETWRQKTDTDAIQETCEDAHLRLQVGPETLQGAVVMGDQALSLPLQDLIVEKANVTPIRDALLKHEKPVAELINNFWLQRKKEHAA